MSLPDEQELLERARTWDLGTFSMIYDQYSPGIFRYALRLLGDANLAEDCVADTFERFLKALRMKQGPREYLKAYLYRIAHNWITDMYRRKAPCFLELADSIEEPGQISIEGQLNDQLEIQKVRLALRALTPDQRQVIILRFFEGWDNREVAASLGRSEGAIKALQNRGLTMLRRLLIR